ncbi:hypothetical protein SALBM135S_07734 [Streptomyces alboniger]
MRTIIEMVAATRLDCVIGSSALMRQAVVQAVHHATYREAFGGRLIDKPLMRNVLADLALESEAATTLAMRLAAAYDDGGEQERAFLRIAVPAAKYWVTKRCTPMVGEALECLGGNGYVEESGMPRLLREAPLNSIWEGSGRNRRSTCCGRCNGSRRRSTRSSRRSVRRAAPTTGCRAAIKDLLTELADLAGAEARARRLTERMALVLQGSLLVRYAPPEVSDAFCASRLGGDGHGVRHTAAQPGPRLGGGAGRRAPLRSVALRGARRRDGGAAPTRHHHRTSGPVRSVDTARAASRPDSFPGRDHARVA